MHNYAKASGEGALQLLQIYQFLSADSGINTLYNGYNYI